MGYFRGWTDNVIGRIIDAVLAIPLIVFAILILTALSGQSEGINVTPLELAIVIGLAFTPPSRARCAPRRSPNATSTTCRRPSCAASARRTSCSPRSSRTSCPRSSSRPPCASATRSSPPPTLAFLSYGVQPPTPDWGLDIAEQYQNVELRLVGGIFPALAIASLVVAVNLIADAVQQVLEG